MESVVVADVVLSVVFVGETLPNAIANRDFVVTSVVGCSTVMRGFSSFLLKVVHLSVTSSSSSSLPSGKRKQSGSSESSLKLFEFCSRRMSTVVIESLDDEDVNVDDWNDCFLSKEDGWLSLLV